LALPVLLLLSTIGVVNVPPLIALVLALLGSVFLEHCDLFRGHVAGEELGEALVSSCYLRLGVAMRDLGVGGGGLTFNVRCGNLDWTTELRLWFLSGRSGGGEQRKGCHLGKKGELHLWNKRGLLRGGRVDCD